MQNSTAITNTLPDTGTREYSTFIHASRYARWRDDVKRRETWRETVTRYFDFFVARHRGLAPQIAESLDAVLRMDVMPSMRALWAAGPALERCHATAYNCFTSDTEIVTEKGVQRFGDLGSLATVLDGDGQWVEAEIRSFGQQPIQRVTFKPGACSRTKLRHSVDATPNHRWITDNRGEVTDIRVGDLVRFNSPVPCEIMDEAFVRGFGFGDGTIDVRGHARIRLCGKKAEHLPIFQKLGNSSTFYCPSANGDPLVVFRGSYMNDWKKLPTDQTDATWLASWFMGYLAADGHSGVQPGLSSQNAEAIEFAKRVAPLAGFCVTGQNTDSCMSTNFGKRASALQRITLRRDSLFRVTSIEDLETVEEVYCAVVPTTRSFTLANGILTGNCAFAAVDSPRVFDEAIYILMSGCGLGFSVERQYIAKLPEVPEHARVGRRIQVADSREGWAQAFRELIEELYDGWIPSWNLAALRPAGARLHTMGGRSSGPGPLDDLFRFTVETFRGAAGRKLNSLECHDLMCMIGSVVVAGGVRRSAMISLSNPSDARLCKAKSGQWWHETGYRSIANNSAAYTERPDFDVFLTEWVSLHESKSGERGIYNRVAAQNKAEKIGRLLADFGVNPCGEISLRSMQFCNLTEVVIRAHDTLDTLKEKVRHATILGTLQSGLTEIEYLRNEWRSNCEDERLLGVSLTGITDHVVFGDPDHRELATHLAVLRRVARETNVEWAAKIGVRPSAAITTVKPSGTVSQLVNSSSGIHARFAAHYLRRVRAAATDPLAMLMRDQGFACEVDVTNDANLVFSFPVAAPEGARLAADIDAITQCKLWTIYNEHWADHSVSCTIYYSNSEFLALGQWVWSNFDKITGLSFLPRSEHSYRQAPYEAITREQYETLVAAMPVDVDWSKLAAYETGDTTAGAKTFACSGDVCEIVDLSPPTD